jgi:hypothetical protein
VVNPAPDTPGQNGEFVTGTREPPLTFNRSVGTDGPQTPDRIERETVMQTGRGRQINAYARVRRAAALAVAAAALTGCTPGSDPAPDADQAIQPLPIATPESGAVVASQGAAVSQNLAQAQITVVYNRPVARGREIFGHLVPFDEPWHPGADQATVFRTTADILVDGELLPAGRYSLWVVPSRANWEIIFHRDWNVFHLPYPGDEGVELRLSLEPQTAEHMETMAFYFPVTNRREGVLAFHWADTRLEIPLAAPGPDDG